MSFQTAEEAIAHDLSAWNVGNVSIRPVPADDGQKWQIVSDLLPSEPMTVEVSAKEMALEQACGNAHLFGFARVKAIGVGCQLHNRLSARKALN